MAYKLCSGMTPFVRISVGDVEQAYCPVLYTIAVQNYCTSFTVLTMLYEFIVAVCHSFIHCFSLYRWSHINPNQF